MNTFTHEDLTTDADTSDELLDWLDDDTDTDDVVTDYELDDETSADYELDDETSAETDDELGASDDSGAGGDPAGAGDTPDSNSGDDTEGSGLAGGLDGPLDSTEDVDHDALVTNLTRRNEPRGRKKAPTGMSSLPRHDEVVGFRGDLTMAPYEVAAENKKRREAELSLNPLWAGVTVRTAKQFMRKGLVTGGSLRFLQFDEGWRWCVVVRASNGVQKYIKQVSSPTEVLRFVGIEPAARALVDIAGRGAFDRLELVMNKEAV